MNLKQRIVSILLTIGFIGLLAYVSVHSVSIGDTVDAIMLQRLNTTYNRDGGLGTGFYQKYIRTIEQLKNEVHRVRKKFLSWRAHLQLNKKRKNITMDVMNEGHHRSCKGLTLLIMVSSELSHKTRRDIIRSTYLNQTHWWEYSQKRAISFGMLFIVGRSKNETQMASVMSESKQQGDMLVLDLEESFYSLSYKVMIGFQWVTEHCQGYRFLLKGDDDIFVNIHALMELLHEPTTPQTHLYVGNTMSVAEVVRNGRYGVSREEYKRDNYPRYNRGVVSWFLVTSCVA